MEKHLTSFKITVSVRYLETEILNETGLPQTVFHRKAIDDFLKGDGKIDEELKITKRTDPQYVKKSYTEQIYLDEVREKKLEAVAEKENTKKTVVLFQALLNFCLKNAHLIDENIVKNIIQGSYITKK